MILKRSVYQKLLAWKNECCGSKALLVEGARRIGKSTIVEEFAKREYKSYILIDFFKEKDEVKNYFTKYSDDFDTLFMGNVAKSGMLVVLSYLTQRVRRVRSLRRV